MKARPRWLSFPLGGLCALGGALTLACTFDAPAIRPLGTELGDEACSDGYDDDRDGRADCDDLDCAATASHCTEIVPAWPLEAGPEGAFRRAPGAPVDGALTLALCTDQLDNDRDGRFDCGDAGCYSVPELCCPREQAPLAETTPCPPGAGCAPGTEAGAIACSDGADNDRDGFIDCDDYDCARGLDASVRERCAAGREATPDACSNGVDDDGDGFADCEDFDCRDRSEPALAVLCRESAREVRGQLVLSPDERCSDGIDNDGDGFADCEDWDCSFDELVTVCPGAPPGHCAPDEPDPPPACARPDGPRLCP